MNFTRRLRSAVPLLLVICGVAAFVVFLGSPLADGEPPEPATPAEDTMAELPTALPTFPGVTVIEFPDGTAEPTPLSEAIRGFFVTPAFTVTPTPIGRTVVAGREVTLPDGMIYQQIINPNRPGQKTFALIYPDPSGVSRVALDENGEILASEVIPEHRDIFEPILPSAYLPQ